MSAEPTLAGGSASLPAPFEPLALLSRARSYEVWDAWDPRRACRVVLKVLRADRRDDQRAAARLRSEGELLERLRHPHIVRALETVPGPRPAIVLETLGGATLSHLVDEEDPLTEEEIAHLSLQLISALAYLHGAGWLHLDLKPSNVIAEAGRARLIDLGLASPAGRLEPELGTWCYMAPEQVGGERVGAAADVWGLGAVMFECACGFPPFDDPAHEGGAERRARRDTTASEQSRPREYPQLRRRARAPDSARTIDPRLGRLISACLAPDPDARPDLAGLAAALEELAGLEPAQRRLARSVRR